MNPIIFTRNAARALKNRLDDVPASDIFVLTDTNSRKHCLDRLELRQIADEHLLTLEAGEPSKSLDHAAWIWQRLSTGQARRNAVLVNVGGGMVTDIGGFAASCFKRGIRCINVPTTLLSQVDASIGGKTGINFNGLKNEIGTFSLPEEVIIDNSFLASLPDRQVLSGFAEMLKHALLANEKYLAEILECDLHRAAEEDFLPLIRKSVTVKEAIISGDLREKGLRKALNFGHTAGHAIESEAIRKKSEVYHGDAVAYGMIAELYLSVKKTGFNEKLFEALRKFIRGKYPAYRPADAPEALYEWMLHDKKNEHEGVNFTLLHSPGEIETDQYCNREEIIEAFMQI